MDQIELMINGQAINVPVGVTILEAARYADLYIPALCSHPNLPPAQGIESVKLVYQGERMIVNAKPEDTANGCGLCVVEVEGQPELVPSCSTEARDGMIISTENKRIKAKRQKNLIPILERHCHACLTCAQQEGCSRTPCSANVPENERCCSLFGHCELQDIANYIGIPDATPKWIPTNLPVLNDGPLFKRDYNLCIGCTRCVRACRELRGIEAIGFVYDKKGHIQVGTLAPTLAESGCKFCTACVAVCPTGALMDHTLRPGNKEADLVPCKDKCPVHMDVPGYLRLIAQGKPDEAHAIIREKVPFPGILGRVCTHPCETACRRGEVNEPISICALKRYAADGEKGLWKKRSRIEPHTGKNIAVIGSGPAGLTAAFYLRKQGHGITVFESRAKAGGMMRYGIPTFRLPRAILDQEIGDILALGIDIRFNHTLGKDFTLEQLKDRGYDAVFLGIGAQLSRSIQLNGSALTDVLGGVDFLVQVAQGAEIRLENRVVVIGGGNVAVDVALTALRCGANDVTMVCLECQEEMPAHASVLKEARSEGVKLRPSWGPGRILRQGRQITGMELIQCRCVFDDQGNFCPEFGEAKEKIEVDQVIMAIGQTTDLSFLGVDHQISNNKGLIVVDLDTFETPLPGVYAGGDVTALAGTLIHAIAAGRKAAASIDRALGGTGNIDEVLYQQEALQPHLGRDKGFASWPREHRPALEVGKRHTGFQEIVLGYTTELAVREAKRCLQCDLRLYLACNPSPPKSVLPLNAENIRGVPETEGVFQLLDETHRVLIIKGTPHLRRDLLEELERSQKATLFAFEEDKMYSKRESELIQRYLQEYGEMPGGEEDDDLF